MDRKDRVKTCMKKLLGACILRQVWLSRPDLIYMEISLLRQKILISLHSQINTPTLINLPVLLSRKYAPSVHICAQMTIPYQPCESKSFCSEHTS